MMAFNDIQGIDVCADHSEYITPLIWSYVFNGNEWFCPYCGKKYPMFGGSVTQSTAELENRSAKYRAKIGSKIDGDTFGWWGLFTRIECDGTVIRTKYAVGYEVWLLQKMKPIAKKIVEISVFCNANSVLVLYGLEGMPSIKDNPVHGFVEGQLFQSEFDLLTYHRPDKTNNDIS